MPLRSLGYVASALEVAKNHLPLAQVQFVYTIRTGQRVNGTLPRGGAISGGQFMNHGRAFVNSHYGDIAGNVTFLTDPAGAPDIDENDIAAALTHTAPQVQEKLLKSAGRREGSYLSYVAAHLAMHDTVGGLVHQYKSKEPLPIEPECIVSLGAQSERPFYEARMACREQGVAIPGLLEATGQLFTKHVLPPYFECREGEISITAPELLGVYIEHGDGHAVPSVQRDLEYLQSMMQQEPVCVGQ
jgi:hypothetical protein